MDLLAVFDVRKHRFKIVSYEHDIELAKHAAQCPVFRTLSRIPSVGVHVVTERFPGDAKYLLRLRRGRRVILFLDYTGTFRPSDADSLLEVMRSNILTEGDFFMITSCLSPRIVNQKDFMKQFVSSFRLFFKVPHPDGAFRVRNHVDLLVAQAMSQLERSTELLGERRRLGARLLRKFRYADTKCPMGLWLFQVIQTPRISAIADQKFEEFPHAFSATPQEPPLSFNIFD